MNKTVAIITQNKFPRGDAGSLRLEAFAKILIDNNYDVEVYSLSKCSNFNFQSFNGIKYVSLRYEGFSKLSAVKTHLLFKRNLKSFIHKKHYDYIIFTELQQNTSLYLKKYAKRNNSKLFYDCVEWYSSCEFKNGIFNRNYIKKNYYNSRFTDKNINVISISSYLNNYFLNKKIKTINIPVILPDCYKMNITSGENNELNLIYCGSPFGKDDLRIVIESLLEINKTIIKKIKLNVVGVTLEQAITNKIITNDEKMLLNDSICFKGRLSHEKVLEEYSKADFSILMRPINERYSKAGFPTKFVESLQNSVPVITNLSSDLNRYLINKVNGIVVNDYDKDSLVVALNTALKLSQEEIVSIKKQAYETFMKEFYYKNYETIFLAFMKDC